jgi:hypothetical protein
LFAAALVASAGAPWAGDESQNPKLFFVQQEIVKPPMAAQYEAALRDMIEQFRKAGVDASKLNFSVLSGDETGYLHVFPFEGMAGLERVNAGWADAAEKLGEGKWQDLYARTSEPVESRNNTAYLLREDLSYRPAKPRLAPDEVRYVHYTYYFALPGKENDLEEVAAKYVDLFRAREIADGYTVYQAVFGSDLPVYVVVQGAKSPADLHAGMEADNKKLGPDGEKLGREVSALIRRMERNGAWKRPDLSFVAD